MDEPQTKFLREDNDCNEVQDQDNFKELVELLSDDDSIRQLEKKATTCFSNLKYQDQSELDPTGLKKLKEIFPKIEAYTILGVNPDSNLRDINEAYNNKLRDFKSDKKQTMKIYEAYEFLSTHEGGKRKSKKRHYKPITKTKTTRNKILKRRRSRKRDKINRRKSRKINLYK